MTITLETIFKELQEIKKRLSTLEKLLLLEEEDISEYELKELNNISNEMKKGNKIPWNP